MRLPHRLVFRGFTLVEILTAMAVLSLLFTIMFGIMQQTSKGWQAANRRVEASQAARLALDQISADLENCVAFSGSRAQVQLTNGTPLTNATNVTKSYGFGFVHAEGSRITGTNAWLPSAAQLSLPNDYIFVVTPYSPSQSFGTGDLAEAGYVPVRVGRGTAGSGYGNVRIGRYALLRSFPVRYPRSAGGVYSVSNAQPITDFLNNATNWETTPGLKNDATATNFFPILDNCVGFDVRFVYGSGTSTRVTNVWGRPLTNGTWGPIGVHPPDAPNSLPLAAIVTICVVDERTAERLYRMNSNGLSSAVISNLVASVTNVAALNDIPDSPPGLRQTLREGMLGFQRQVFFKNATP